MSDRPPKMMIDWCAGLGGASAPARDRGWRVVTLDIEAAFKPSILADIRNPPIKPVGDLLWISIPCEGFARCAMPWFPDTEPDLQLAHAAKRLVDTFAGDWVVECNRASRKWLSPIFGRVSWCNAGHAIWSNLLILANDEPRRAKESFSGSDHAKRALVPYWLASAAIDAASRK